MYGTYTNMLRMVLSISWKENESDIAPPPSVTMVTRDMVTMVTRDITCQPYKPYQNQISFKKDIRKLNMRWNRRNVKV